MDLKDKYVSMSAYEQEAFDLGYTSVAGIDEAGRGPLAGPIVCAAVILNPEFQILGLDDSKKISEKKRNLLFNEICEHALSYSIIFIDAKSIDDLGIAKANALGFKQAIAGLKIRPDFLLTDYFSVRDTDLPQQNLVKGDTLSVTIAAASILAKVSRDRYMLEQSTVYPEYEFHKHKGYGTKRHRELFDIYGPCLIHRKSFLSKWLK